MHEEVVKYLSKIGRKGGKVGGVSTSRKKIKAVMANLEIAHEAKRKYPACKHYKNKSHRFNPNTNKCYACGYERK